MLRIRIRLFLGRLGREKHWFLGTVLLLWLLYESLKNYVNVPSESNKQKNLEFLVAILKVTDEKSRIRRRIR
jgi:hypothetical protein